MVSQRLEQGWPGLSSVASVGHGQEVTLTQLAVSMPVSFQPRSSWLHLQHMADTFLHCPPVPAYGVRPLAGLLCLGFAEEWGFPSLQWDWRFGGARGA